jgi:hypothetical protein
MVERDEKPNWLVRQLGLSGLPKAVVLRLLFFSLFCIAVAGLLLYFGMKQRFGMK